LLSIGERIDPEKTALIVIDVQNDFCHPDGACARAFRADTRHIDAALPTLHSLIEGAAAAGVFTVYIRSNYADSNITEAYLDQSERNNCVGPNRICQPGSWGSEFYGGIAPDAARGDVIVEKYRFSAFFGTTLEAELKSRDISRVIVSGFTTSVCVDSTAREAYFRGYYVSIAADAVAEWDPELHAATLKLFDRTFGHVLPVAEILGVWSSTKPAVASPR
jgi:ureidoacrylate peracid hydrolase